ncbi:MAG: HAMP domain-containing protein [Clostridia bacterium]|nr:HAMP domain-containing protein [Clostridia bacterium]
MSLIFLLIIGISFVFVAYRLTGYVSEYLYEQRIRQDSISLERLATTVAPLFQSAKGDALTETLSSASGEMGGRLLVLDTDGKIQFDAFTALMGTRLPLPEVIDVLSGSPKAWGIHRLTQELPLSSSGYVACSASPMIGTQGTLGVLLLVSDVGDLIESLETVQRELTVIFAVAALGALLAAIFFSHVLTRPISALSRTMARMGEGDLTVRAPVAGSGEIQKLAESYNIMAEQLESLDQSRNQFVSNASHELKTPMTSMKILLESVIYQPDMPEELRTEFLTDINHEIDRLTHIVTDLLELTRMDNGQLQLSNETVDLSEVVSEAIRLLEGTAATRAQSISSLVTPGITVQGEAAKLKQIATNLIDNALKYSADGQKVEVTLSRQGKQAVFTVRDEGVGISADDQKHIFERFYRVDKARSRETGGTGLGLSIVRQLVTLHSGTITVDSTPGKGSVFTVTLPLSEKEVSKA